MKVAAYIRNSSDQQEGSQAQQEAAIKTYCDRLGLELIQTYRDEGISGIDTAGSDRHGFQALVRDAPGAQWTEVVVYELSRLTRSNPFRAITELSPLIEAGVTLRTTDSDASIDGADFIGLMQLALGSQGSSDYVKRLARQVLRGQAAAAKSGKWQGGLPWGYERDEEGRLTPSEDAPIIAEMFQWRSDGDSYKTIKTKLEEHHGITKPCSAIAKVLRNCAYKGQLRFGVSSRGKLFGLRGGEVTDRFERTNRTSDKDQIIVDDSHPAIVPPKVFDALQKAAPRRANANTSKPRLLTGKCRCGTCTGPLSYAVQSSGKLKLRCTRWATEGTCSPNLVSESEVIDALLDLIQTNTKNRNVRKTITKLLDTSNKDLRKGVSLATIAKRLEREYKKLSTMEDRLLTVTDAMAARLAPKVEAQQSIVDDLEAQVSELKKQQPVDVSGEVDRIETALSDLKHHFAVSPMEQQRAMLDKLINSVVLNIGSKPYGKQGRRQYFIKAALIGLEVGTPSTPDVFFSITYPSISE